ncbi:hypothetical protein QUC31_001740 [Theobroma cacao]
MFLALVVLGTHAMQHAQQQQEENEIKYEVHATTNSFNLQSTETDDQSPTLGGAGTMKYAAMANVRTLPSVETIVGGATIGAKMEAFVFLDFAIMLSN